MISIRLNPERTAPSSIAGLSTAIGFPEHVHGQHGHHYHDHPPLDYGAEDMQVRSRHILLLPGLFQVLIGTVALLAVKCDLGDLLAPLKFAVMWIICSGAIGLCSTVCTEKVFSAVTCTGPVSRQELEPEVQESLQRYRYQRFSHYSIHVYQAIVLFGVVLNFVAAMHGAALFRSLPSVPNQSTGLCSATTRLETSEAGWSTLWAGSCLCGFQIIMLATVACGLNRRKQKDATKERSPGLPTRQSVLGTGTSATEEHTEVQQALLHETRVTPTAPALSVIPESPSTWSTILRLNRRPPRYSTVGLPFTDYPPPFTSRRNTMHSIRSLPPAYTEASVISHSLQSRNESSGVDL